MRARIGLSLVMVVGVAAVGCAAPVDGDAGSAPGTTQSLAAVVAVAAMDATVASRVTFTIAGGFDAARPETMSIAQPLLRVHAGDGKATLDELRLPLGDIDVPAEALPPSGLELRDLVLSATATRATVVRADDDTLELTASAPLTLDWSLQLSDGRRYPLGAVQTAPLALDVRVVRADGTVRAIVDARCDGTCWAIDGIARLSDGAVHLEADASVTAAP